MNPYAASAFITSLSACVVGTIVFCRKSRSKLAGVFFVYSNAIALWAFLTATHSIYPSQAVSLICAKASQGVTPFIPVLFFHFVLVLLGLNRKNRFRAVLLGGYSSSLVMGAIAASSNLFVARVRPKLGFHYFMDGGAFLPLIVIFFILYSIAGLALLAWALPKHSGLKRNQLQYLFWGSLVGYASGISNFLPVYDLTLFPYPYGSLGITFYSFVTAYAIVKYRLLEVDVFIGKTLVFAGLFTFVFGVISFGVLVAQELLATYFGLKWQVALGISIFLIVLGYEPMREFLIEITDRYLFQKKYDYRKLLKDAATGIAQIESFSHLLHLVTHFITMRVRVKNAAVLTRDLGTNQFRLGYQRGYGLSTIEGYTLWPRSSLIRYFEQEKETIEIEQVKEYIEGGWEKAKRRDSVFAYDFVEIKRELEGLRASCCIPSFLGRELRNILVLGEKK